MNALPAPNLLHLGSTGRAAAFAMLLGVGSMLAPTSLMGQQLDDTEDLLRRLTEAPGPPAFEEAVRHIVTDEFEALGASVDYDGLGSVHAELPGGGAGPRSWSRPTWTRWVSWSSTSRPTASSV